MMCPRRLLDNVWLVGSGSDPVVLTDRHDSNVYLIWNGSSGVVIDSSSGLAFNSLLASIQRVCNPSAIKACLVTHYHADHAGGAAAFSKLGVPVLGSELTARALRVSDHQRTQVEAGKQAGIYPLDYQLQSAEVEPVGDGYVLGYDSFSIECIASPGHCDGHMVFLLVDKGRRIMFSGDCLFAGGCVSIQAIPDCRLDVYASTVKRLAQREVDAMLPGHGDAVLSEASVDVRRAADAFARLRLPQNFLGP